MPRFNVGDRVRRVDDGGFHGDMPIGTEGRVTSVDPDDDSYCVEDEGDGIGWYGFNVPEGGEFDWELIAAADDGRMEHTTYLLYVHGGGITTPVSCSSPAQLEQFVGTYTRMGYEILGKKKITTRIQRPN